MVRKSQRDPTRFLDVIDDINIFLLGPNAAFSKQKRVTARKQFRRAARGFSEEFRF